MNDRALTKGSNLSRTQRTLLPLWKRVVMALIGMAMLASLFGGASSPQTAQASLPVGDVIFNYPYALEPGTTSVSPTVIDWNYAVDHNDGAFGGYEQAYTQSLSEQYNGTATPDHTVLSDDSTGGGAISFYGYGIQPYMDYLFTSTSTFATQGLSFIMRPLMMNFHTFSESGYLFNGQMTQSAGNTYYTGYAVILSCANEAGMQENDATAPNTAALRVFYINNELWDTENFRPGNSSNTRTLVATIKTGINNFDSTPYRVSVEIDPATRSFKVFVDGACYATVDAPVGGAAGPTGFGFYTGYYAHDCTILTRIRYEYIAINVAPVTEPPVPANCQVNFEEQGTGLVLRAPETETGYVNQRYRIVQPLKITYDGTIYYLVDNSRNASTRSDIKLTYGEAAGSNATTLYYVKPSALTAKAPEKSAQVNEGDWDTGSLAAPVQVTAGSQIKYDVTAYAPPTITGTPMLTQGNNGSQTDTTWWGQTNGTMPSGGVAPVQKQLIATITFVNLPNYLVPSVAITQFLDTYSQWNGKNILRVWDATDTTTANQDRNIQRVVAWLTASDTAGRYDLYVGGQGGVWMSASSSDSYLFANYYNVTSIDFSNFHTDKAVNMSYMFSALSSNAVAPPNLDMSHFDTSNVMSMNYMFSQFANYSKVAPNLDLSHFNTSRVTTMYGMFQNVGYSSTDPPILNISHFDTSQVTNMYNMFNSYSYSSQTPPVLDLSSFNTSNVTIISMMFYQFAYSSKTAPTLDLSRFDVSKVADMSYMFFYYAYSATANYTLDLRWWKIGTAIGGTSVYAMFCYCPRLTTLYLQSGTFSAATISSSVNMLNTGNSSLKVSVKTAADQTWMYSASTGTGVPTGGVSVAGAPSGTQPQPVDWRTNWTPPLPFGSADSTIVTDTIPDGLTIDPKTITGVESMAPIDDNTITWQLSGQTITWTIPSSQLPADVSVTVTVDQVSATQPVGKVFENKAVAGGVETNHTWHQLTGGWSVTEQYYIYDGGSNSTQLDDDLTTNVTGTTYTVRGSTSSLYGYSYYGYQRVGIDDDIVTGQAPPDPAYGPSATDHSDDFTTTNHETIILYYKKDVAITVTIHFVDETGAEIQSPLVAGAALNQDYYLLNSSFNSIDVAGTIYTYYNYAAAGSTTGGPGPVADQGMPALALPPGNAPVYPDGATPTFVAADMTQDRDVTLYFTTQKAVKVHFAEASNPSHVLHQDETYLVTTPTFNAGGAARTDDSQPLPYQLIDPVTGKTYTYRYYSLDSGESTSAALPGTVFTPADIILYFSTSYIVTEKFHTASSIEETAVVLLPDESYDISGGDPFYALDGKGAPPSTIGRYTYIGYKFGNDSNPLIPGYPSTDSPLIDAVNEDSTIIYVYELTGEGGGIDFSFCKVGEGNAPLEGVVFKLTPRNAEGTGWEGAGAVTVVSAGDGEVTFAGLIDKSSYLLEEIQAFPGYALPSGSWILTVDSAENPVFSLEAKGSPMAFARNADTDTYTLTNYKIAPLPFSGGWGVITFIVAGIVLVGTAFIVLMTLKSKKKNVRQGRQSP